MDDLDLLGEALDDMEDEILGYDDYDDDDMLGRRRGRRGRGGRRGSKKAKRKTPLVKEVPGVSGEISGARLPMGLGEETWTNASTDTSFTLTTNPQKPVRIRRLICIVNRSSGAAAIACTITDLQVGTNSQFASPQSMPAEAFSAEAEGVTLKGDSATPGINVTLTGHISAIPGAGESVTLQAVLFVDSVVG